MSEQVEIAILEQLKTLNKTLDCISKDLRILARGDHDN